MNFSKFQETILVLCALKNIFQNDLKVIKRYITDNDLKFSLTNKILIDITSFLEEWKRVESYAKENESIRKTLKITSYAIRRIRSWHDIKSARNTMLAHGFRDEKEKGKLTCLNKRYINANVPTTYAEIMLLAEFAVYAISAITCRHPTDFDITQSIHPKYEAAPTRGIETLEEFNNEVEKLKKLMFELDPSLKKCFGF